MSGRTAAFDWSGTPLGPVEGWPRALRTVVRVMLDSRYAMWLGWGPDLTFFYNDAYARMSLGPKHPWALGRPAREVWSEIWDDIGPRAESVVRTGRATWDEGLLLFLERRGFPEETYHTFSYSPVPDDEGGVGGMLCVVTEDTERTIGERRLRTLRELAARTTVEAKSAEEACRAAAQILEGNPLDVPFALIYLLDEGGRRLALAGSAGVAEGSAIAPSDLDPSVDAPWPFRLAEESAGGVVVEGPVEGLGPLPGGAWPEPSRRAVVVPMARPGQSAPAGFVVAGVSSRRPFDDGYRGFLDLVAGQIATAVANARAYEEERRRVEELAEIDRVKTAFFSNVSHEFRTPLTLMLGPVEDLLEGAEGRLRGRDRELLEVVNRNGLRLLRLVNSLLDVSRIQAGRARAAYEPTDLAAFTADLASGFRSACERAGLSLVVDCPPLGEPAFVDREMWEKVVLNLVSNAFKFTLEGEIRVGLRREGDSAVLEVRDTGTGIPAGEMPRLFERFHRVESARGRTHEGSGIGLALVQELVKLHGGSVSAESEPGVGSTFRVEVPLGRAHLPAERIGPGRALDPSATGVAPFVEEALRWLPSDAPSAVSTTPIPAGASDGERAGDGERERERPRVLLADDNADMRGYIARLLADGYRVDEVPDGLAALASARANPPDLVLTDAMMPNLDGPGLIRELRADPKTARLPVVMVSARAGEESRVEGLEAGADDYIVKPFGARELIARVGAQIQMARLRDEAGASVRRSEERLRMALSSVRMVAWDMDLPNRRVVVSENAAEVFGTADVATAGRWFALIHPDDVDRVRAAGRRVAREGGDFLLEYRLIRPDNGEVVWMEDRGYGIRDESGRVVRVVGVNADVTARKRAEEDLLASEVRFQSFMDHSPAGAFIKDARGCYLFVNRIFEEQFDRPLLDWVGKSDLDLFPPSEAVAIRRNDLTVLEARRTAQFEEEASGPDGVRHYLSFKFPLRGRGGGWLLGGMSVDVTERKLAEEALRESEAKYRALAESMPFVLWQADAGGRPEYVNPFCFEYTGMAAETLGDRGWYAAIHPDDIPTIRGGWEDSLRTGAPVEFEYRMRRASDGSYRWFHSIGAPVRDEAGRVVEWVGAALDIQDQRAAEEALRAGEERWRTLAEALPNLVWTATPDGQCDYLSGQWRAYTGISDGELLGTRWLDVIHPDDRRRTIEDWEAACAGRGDYDLEYRIRRHDGEYRWFKTRGVPIRDERGRIVHWFGTCTDIEDVKRLEAALLDADRRKDEFLATLAHELRNPLAPIRNALAVMRRSAGDLGTIEESRDLMERQLAQMVRLIDDLMDVSRITRGKLELRRERVDLASVIRTAVDTSRPLVEAADHELTLTLPGRPIALDADPTRLAQVLSNLLNNAARYTEPGGRIALVAEREGSDVVVAVRDNGVGIPPEMLPRVFDLFTQVDRDLERKQGGLGIGLTLVKRLVEMHGGSVEARSAGVGLGSEFAVRLPIVVAPPPRPTVGQDRNGPLQAAPPRKVLVVDDNQDSARTLARLVALLGHRPRTAHDGGEAVEVAEEYRPDLILLDIGLPVMNGYEVAREIRRRPWGGDVVIVALTGWGQDGDRRRSAEAGIDNHLVKPIDPDDLERLLASTDARSTHAPS